MNIWLIIPFVTCIALILTGMLRQYAISRKMMDLPNNRTSHTVPTPRGGGIAIVLSFLITLPLLAISSGHAVNSILALSGAGICVALVGFLDDHGHIPARWRLTVHFVGSIWALILLGGLPPLSIFGSVVDFGWIGQLFAVLYLVWLLNLYNFMDGIDGIAGLEAMTVCLGGILLHSLSSYNGSEWIPMAILLAAVTGFLVWNFPKAKIFMGDAGSGFLGVVLGILSIQAAWISPELFWAWLVLLGAFMVDATVTLINRMIRRERFYEAHRSHAYQYASRKYGSHVVVSLTFAVINLLWLLPVAILIVLGWVDGVIGLGVAYTPLVFLAIKYKAGARELQEV